MSEVPTVRAERPGDEAAISAVHAAAFGGPAEARLTERLREEGAFSPRMSLLAVMDERVVGHALFSELGLRSVSRRAPKVAALAPLGVLPGYQKQGIGAALVREGLESLRALGFDAVFVLGDPTYYRRFGFAPEIGARVHSPYAGPAFQGLELTEGALLPVEGAPLEYPAAFSRL